MEPLLNLGSNARSGDDPNAGPNPRRKLFLDFFGTVKEK
ncbi:hypothetical protein RR11_1918 [Ruegeria sp. R11]|nr:hypothetical protein RR11_1918 [Ruegeria sp. R11]CRL14375.1 hypothetical protein NIT7645_01403 [Phaeobacter italicus]SFG27570.1 hypothetical protein SAMN04488019_101740 [Phaeobacter italicus]